MKSVTFTYAGYEFKYKNYSYAAGSPGRYSGPPEYCYPEEPPELDGGELYIRSPATDKWQEITGTMFDFMFEKAGGTFWQAALNAIEEAEEHDE
jgi:hypothetical protein